MLKDACERVHKVEGIKSGTFKNYLFTKLFLKDFVDLFGIPLNGCFPIRLLLS